MSYTPEDQLLEPGINKIIEGIELLRDAAHARIAAPNDYTQYHIQEMIWLCTELTELEVKLRQM